FWAAAGAHTPRLSLDRKGEREGHGSGNPRVFVTVPLRGRFHIRVRPQFLEPIPYLEAKARVRPLIHACGPGWKCIRWHVEWYSLFARCSDGWCQLEASYGWPGFFVPRRRWRGRLRGFG